MIYVIYSRTYGTWVHVLDKYSTPSVTDDIKHAHRYNSLREAWGDAGAHGIIIPENDLEVQEVAS